MEQLSSHKGQASTIDFIIGLAIMIIALIIGITIIISIQEPSNFSHVKRQAISASEQLMSEGYPKNWTNETIFKLGLLTNNVLNESKVTALHTLSYHDMRARLVEDVQIYGYFENSNGIINTTACGFGSPEVTVDSNCVPTVHSDENIVAITRIVSFNDTLTKMVVIVWG